MKLVFQYLSKYKIKVFFTLIIKILATFSELIIPYILSYIIDVVILKRSTPRIIVWGGIMIICSLMAFLLNAWANTRASKLAKNSTKKLRYDLFKKIEDLTETTKDKITLPSLVGRMTTDTYNIHHFSGMIMRLGVRAPILLIGGIIICFFVDHILTLIMLGLFPIILLTIFIIAKRSIPLFKKLQVENDLLIQDVRENYTGCRVIKALAKEDDEINNFNEINNRVSDTNKEANIKYAGLNPIINVLLNVGLVLVILLGAYRCNIGLCSKGSIVSFTSYFTIISNAVLTFTRLFIVYSKANASQKRIYEVFEICDNVVIENNLNKSDYFIEFNNVTFSYLKKNSNIKDISFKINKNESLGIIGATGSGKTTIINLLMRFYEIDKGDIYYDGINIKEFNPIELRKRIGVVFQNDIIFNDSIYENVSFGRNLSVEEVTKALEDAQAIDFVNKKEDGISSILDSYGTNLSGGQRQRILIARALAGNPEMIILDDSSSALDYKTDQKLRNILYKKYNNLIIVAQRISSIKDCKKIIVLDKGKIVGYGTHDELLKSCDIYSQISFSQMGV